MQKYVKRLWLTFYVNIFLDICRLHSTQVIHVLLFTIRSDELANYTSFLEHIIHEITMRKSTVLYYRFQHEMIYLIQIVSNTWVGKWLRTTGNTILLLSYVEWCKV
jgi:hypothetical protein